MVNAVTSAQGRTPMRTRTDRAPAERTPAERGPGSGRPSPTGLPRHRMAPSALALLDSARRGLADGSDRKISSSARSSRPASSRTAAAAGETAAHARSGRRG